MISPTANFSVLNSASMTSNVPAQAQLILLASASVPIAAAVIPRMLRLFVTLVSKIPPMLYDTFLVDMTEVWYREVLSRMEKGQKVLDVGVGTGGT
jgi:hypothetical protein